MLGQHSLHLFTFHIIFVQSLALILNGQVPSELVGTGILCLAVGSLLALAYWLQANKDKPLQTRHATNSAPVGT